MLDIAGILFSSLMMLYVIVQAVRLDAVRPWFETPPKPPAQIAETKPRSPVVPWRERHR